MAHCTNCGSAEQAGKFCTACGTPIESRHADSVAAEQTSLSGTSAGVPETSFNSRARSPETVSCPFCAEEIKAAANLCRFCNNDVSRYRIEREEAHALMLADMKAAEIQRIETQAAEQRKRLQRERQEVARAAAKKEEERKLEAEALERSREEALARRRARSRAVGRFFLSWKGISLAAITVLIAVTITITSLMGAQANHLAWQNRIDDCSRRAHSDVQVASIGSGEIRLSFKPSLNPYEMPKESQNFVACIQMSVVDLASVPIGTLREELMSRMANYKTSEFVFRDTSAKRELLNVAITKASRSTGFEVVITAGKDY